MKTRKIHVSMLALLLAFVVLAGCGQATSSENSSVASSSKSEIAVSSTAVSGAADSTSAAVLSSPKSLATSSQGVAVDTSWYEKGYRITELKEPVKVDGTAMASFSSFDEEKIMRSTKVIVKGEVMGGPKNYFTEYMDFYGPDRTILQTYQIRIDKVLYSDGVVVEGDVINVIGGQILFSAIDKDGKYRKGATDGWPKLTKGKHIYLFLCGIPSSAFEKEKLENKTFLKAQFAVAQYSVNAWYHSIDILGDNEYQFDCDAFPSLAEWSEITQSRTFVDPGSTVKVRHSNFDGLILNLVEKHKDIIAADYK